MDGNIPGSTSAVVMVRECSSARVGVGFKVRIRVTDQTHTYKHTHATSLAVI